MRPYGENRRCYAKCSASALNGRPNKSMDSLGALVGDVLTIDEGKRLLWEADSSEQLLLLMASAWTHCHASLLAACRAL